jgi:exopolysaccharide production protein ExoY
MQIKHPDKSAQFETLALVPKTSGFAPSALQPASAGPLGGPTKRAIDIAIAAPALILLLPLLCLIAALIKLSDGGPVLYRHTRVGYGKRSFSCLKFRTMAVNADDLLQKHLAASDDARHEWEQLRKLKVDPRVTIVGHVLRKLSIDELPQVINVLRGEMSIVGPRPVALDEIARYGSDSAFYFRTRPGLTGAWQTSGRNLTSYVERVRLDRKYVENWSIWTDLVIITKTIPIVLLARGSY